MNFVEPSHIYSLAIAACVLALAACTSSGGDGSPGMDVPAADGGAHADAQPSTDSGAKDDKDVVSSGEVGGTRTS